MADGLSGLPRFTPESRDPTFISGLASDEMIWLAENQRRLASSQTSCTHGLSASQKRLATRLLAIFGCLGLIFPAIFLAVIFVTFWILFAVLIVHRATIVIAATSACPDEQPSGKTRRPKKGWPVYSVLVPMFKEAESVPRLMAALKGVDYPKSQLDVIFLIEDVDTVTEAAINDVGLKDWMRIVRLPEGEVRTKPRALNVGLQISRGRFLTIYDAEDEMCPGQLKAAVIAFEDHDLESRLACVQAPLVPHNGHESWIARQFSSEYAVQFGLIVPGLARLGWPVLLGGTSNHFDVEVLKSVYGWDPHNVTEDADLGYQIALGGYRVGHIAPATYEEAPVGLTQWVKQRSRWVKGYMQTLILFCRDLGGAFEKLGVMRTVAALLLLGGQVLSALVHGPFALLGLAALTLPMFALPVPCIGIMCAGLLLHLSSLLLTAPAKHSVRHVFSGLSVIIYWPLQSLAAVKALWELRTNPYFWDKTEHGVSKAKLCRSKLKML